MNAKTKLLIFVLVTAGVISSAVVFANKWRNNVNFDDITIEGNYTISRGEVLATAHLREDSSVNIEELDIPMIQDRISRHPEIKKVFVSKEPPAELKIEIVEKRPIAILNTGGDLKLVDDELEIFPFKNHDKIFDLPVISGIKTGQNVKVFNNLYKNDLRIAAYLILNSYKESKTLYSLLSEINLSDTSKIIVYSSEKSIPFYFPRSENGNIADPEYQKLLWNKLIVFKEFANRMLSREEANEYAYVDLRFSNQVVVNYKKNLLKKEEETNSETENKPQTTEKNES